MFYQLSPFLLLFAVLPVRSSVNLVLTRKFTGNKLFVLLEETDHGLSFPKSILTTGKDHSIIFENLFGLTTSSLLSKKRSSLITNPDILTLNVGGTLNYYYFVRLGEDDHISSRNIEEYRLMEKPSNIEETSFCRNWVDTKSLTNASTFPIHCTMLSMDDRVEFDEFRLVSNDLAVVLGLVSNDLEVAKEKFKEFLEAKQSKNATVEITEVTFLHPSYRYSLGMLPIRLFNEAFYVLLELNHSTAAHGVLMLIKDPKTTLFASLRDFCQAAVKVVEARTGLKIPLLQNGEPSIVNRNKRLIVLSRFGAERNQFEHFLVERIDFGSFPKNNVLSGDNFTTNELVWVNLDDLLAELSSEHIDLNCINVRVITTTKRREALRKNLEDLEEEKMKSQKASKKQKAAGDKTSGSEGGKKETKGGEETPSEQTANEEIVEAIDIGIEYDLVDLLTTPRNLEILKTRLYLYRPPQSKDSLYKSAWTMAGLSFLVGALIPVLYYNFLLKK